MLTTVERQLTRPITGTLPTIRRPMLLVSLRQRIPSKCFGTNSQQWRAALANIPNVVKETLLRC